MYFNLSIGHLYSIIVHILALFMILEGTLTLWSSTVRMFSQPTVIIDILQVLLMLACVVCWLILYIQPINLLCQLFWLLWNIRALFPIEALSLTCINSKHFVERGDWWIFAGWDLVYTTNDFLIIDINNIVSVPTILHLDAGTKLNDVIRWSRSDNKVGLITEQFMYKICDNSDKGLRATSQGWDQLRTTLQSTVSNQEWY